MTATLINGASAKALEISLLPLETNFKVQTIDGSPLPAITHRTPLRSLRVSGNHSEQTLLFIMERFHTMVILGLPWLNLHNPQIDRELNLNLEPIMFHNLSTGCHHVTPHPFLLGGIAGSHGHSL